MVVTWSFCEVCNVGTCSALPSQPMSPLTQYISPTTIVVIFQALCLLIICTKALGETYCIADIKSVWYLKGLNQPTEKSLTLEELLKCSQILRYSVQWCSVI